MDNCMVNKVSFDLQWKFIVRVGGVGKVDVVQVGKIRRTAVLTFAEVVDKCLCLIKRIFKNTFFFYDLNRLGGIVCKHSIGKHFRESRQLLIRLDRHFIAIVVNAADRRAVMEKFAHLVTLGNCKFPCAVSGFSTLTVCAEIYVNNVL